MINPSGMGLQEYADAITGILGRYGATARLIGDDWRSWAIAITQAPLVSAVLPPDPRWFEDWREWASAFEGTLRGLAT